MKIGIVISGGDVSGINNFIFQIARLANADITIFNGGIPGLLDKNHQEVAWRDLVDFSIASIPIITSGRTSRRLLRSEYETIAKKIKSLRIDVLIMAGGDGSLQFLNTLSEFDINCFGVGMTIDNDVYGSDYTIGFSTACEQIIKEVSRLRNTGRALPGRVFMVEILGGYCGELTLQSAIKSNADIALIPESQLPLETLAERVKHKLTQQNSVVILCSEGYTREYSPGFQGAIDTMIKQLEPQIGVRIRKTIVGYGLRNGDPTCEEIYQGTIMASEVVRCIQSGMKNKAIIINASNKPIPIDLKKIKKRLVDTEGHHYKLAKQLVCGCGLGSSFAIEMTAKAVLKKLEIPAQIEHTTISEAGAFKSDMILTQKTFADILTADASEEEIKRVVVLHKLTDKDEIEAKIVAFLKERNLKVADYE